MDTDYILELAKTWLPLVIQVFFLVYIGEFLKKRVLTKEARQSSRVAHLVHKFLPIQPVIAGALMGTIPGFPVIEPYFSADLWGGVLQGVSAGILSTFAYDQYVNYAKHKGWKPIVLVKAESVVPMPTEVDENEDTPIDGST